MGCSASKLDNEDTVKRCKERRRLIKEAVNARHHLAAAHADYCRSLRITGSALSSFGAGEPLSVADETPAVVIHPHTSNPSPPPPPTNPIPQRVPQSPPRPPKITTAKLPHTSQATNRRRPRKLQPKLPHILSPKSSVSGFSNNFFPTAYQADSTYSATPSQASSVWNYENFYPPSPPDSEFFDQKQQLNADTEDNETEKSEYEFFHPNKPNHRHETNSVNSKSNFDDETEREEVECSEWGDHDHDRYTTTSSSDVEYDDVASRSEIGNRESEKLRDLRKRTPPPPVQSRQEMYGAAEAEGNQVDTKMVVRHRDLKEIVDAIKEYFDKAAAAGDRVSEMLEIGRAQLDKSFKQLKKTVYHSSSILSSLSSSWTSKPPLVVKYRLDSTTLNEPGGSKSLCSTLDRLLAWEKKLYEEVKAREGVKIEHEKKLSALQSQEYKGEDETKIDKTKASITRLQSLIIVTSQAVSTTSTAIVGLRDSDLVPQLVEICHALRYMWASMHKYHEVQNHIVQQVRGLINRSAKGDSTSKLHRQATRDLETAISVWHSSFSHLIKFQRDFICSLHGWFKLTLLPVSNDNVDSNSEPSNAYAFCDEWKLTLDRLPDTVASEAIKSFINVVHVISVKQSEELKIKKQTETASKELEKKVSYVRNIEKKFYGHSYSMVGVGVPESGPDHGQVLDARDPLADKKSELAASQRQVEDQMLRHAKAVDVTRAMTLNNLQTGLPGVFQALTSFSALFTEALDSACSRSYHIK